MAACATTRSGKTDCQPTCVAFFADVDACSVHARKRAREDFSDPHPEPRGPQGHARRRMAAGESAAAILRCRQVPGTRVAGEHRLAAPPINYKMRQQGLPG